MPAALRSNSVSRALPIGLGSAAGFALFGTIALVIGGAAAGYVIVRRRRDANCAPTSGSGPVPIELTDTRRR